jgi:hypothetical protein
LREEHPIFQLIKLFKDEFFEENLKFLEKAPILEEEQMSATQRIKAKLNDPKKVLENCS